MCVCAFIYIEEQRTNLQEGYCTFMSLVAVSVDWMLFFMPYHRTHSVWVIQSDCFAVCSIFLLSSFSRCILKAHIYGAVRKPFISKIEQPTYGLKWIWCFWLLVRHFHSYFFTCFRSFFLLSLHDTVVLPKKKKFIHVPRALHTRALFSDRRGARLKE